MSPQFIYFACYIAIIVIACFFLIYLVRKGLDKPPKEQPPQILKETIQIESLKAGDFVVSPSFGGVAGLVKENIGGSLQIKLIDAETKVRFRPEDDSEILLAVSGVDKINLARDLLKSEGIEI